MTPKERAAMQQALEALGSKLGETHPFAHDLEKAAAIRTLREALGYCIDEGCPHHGTTHECTNPLAEQEEQEPVAEALRLSEEAIEYARQGGKIGSGIYGKALAAIRSAKKPQITTPDVCGEVCARAKLCYGCNKDLEEANAQYAERAEQEPVAWMNTNGAVNKLREAGWAMNADPVQQVEQEPVSDYFDFGLEEVEDYLRNCCNSPFMADKLSEIRKSISEPFAYAFSKNETWLFSLFKQPDSIPLYAAPVRTKDLTDGEIRKLWSDAELDITWFARAVIDADREKNRG